MRRRGSLGITLLVAFSGCASRHTVVHPLAPDLLAQLSAEVEGRKAVVSYETAPMYSVGAMRMSFVGDVRVRGKTLVMTDDEREVPLPLAQVTRIDAHHPVRGGIKGGGAGLVAGLLVGILVGSMFQDSCADGREACPSHPMSLSLFAVTGGLLGVALGAPIGASAGSGPVWSFTGAGPELPARLP
jgi:hypothetical protein